MVQTVANVEGMGDLASLVFQVACMAWVATALTTQVAAVEEMIVTVVRKGLAGRRIQKVGTHLAKVVKMEMTELADHGVALEGRERGLVEGGIVVGSTRCMIHRPLLLCCRN